MSQSRLCGIAKCDNLLYAPSGSLSEGSLSPIYLARPGLYNWTAIRLTALVRVRLFRPRRDDSGSDIQTSLSEVEKEKENPKRTNADRGMELKKRTLVRTSFMHVWVRRHHGSWGSSCGIVPQWGYNPPQCGVQKWLILNHKPSEFIKKFSLCPLMEDAKMFLFLLLLIL